MLWINLVLYSENIEVQYQAYFINILFQKVGYRISSNSERYWLIMAGGMVDTNK